MKKMLYEKACSQTKEKFASKIRLENRLNRVRAEIDELTAERDRLNAENNQAYALISLLLSELVNSTDEDLKEKMLPFKDILKKCNV